MMRSILVLVATATAATAFMPPSSSPMKSLTMESSSVSSSRNNRRRALILNSSLFGGLFGSGGNTNPANAAAVPASSSSGNKFSNKGPTNEIIKTVNGMKQRRLGGTDISVSELGLGTQRWISSDFNAPNEQDCFEFMDYAILKHGVNLIDTAEQYPIPSGGNGGSKEGDSERLIAKWIKERNVSRDKVVLCTKITGGRNVTPRNIQADCEGSLKRLGTDYIDVYQLHWPQRYSPQSNWGQSLSYNKQADSDAYWRSNGGPTSFEDLCLSMEKLVQQGKIRGWGLCNDNAYGLTACTRTAKLLGTTPPCSMQGDFSLIDRKSEENGVAEAASPYNENVGFMSYNALAGGMLTGKYVDQPAAYDDFDNRARAMESLKNPRGRMDTRGWGGTLYRYRSEAAQAAIVEYSAIAKKANMSLTELSLRWNRQRSLVTTTLVGHSNLEQLKSSVSYFTNTKALSDEIMWDIDRVHMKNRLPIFSSEHVGKDWDGSGEIGESIP
jgi:aryl-alcohol dehydrogenase-like predicted oxidoreductase